MKAPLSLRTGCRCAYCRRWAPRAARGGEPVPDAVQVFYEPMHALMSRKDLLEKHDRALEAELRQIQTVIGKFEGMVGDFTVPSKDIAEWLDRQLARFFPHREARHEMG